MGHVRPLFEKHGGFEKESPQRDDLVPTLVGGGGGGGGGGEGGGEEEQQQEQQREQQQQEQQEGEDSPRRVWVVQWGSRGASGRPDHRRVGQER